MHDNMHCKLIYIYTACDWQRQYFTLRTESREDFFFPSKWCKIAPKYHIPNHLSRTFIRLNSFSHNLSFIDHKFTIMWTPLSLLQFKHVSTTYFIFRSQEFLIHSASPKQVYVDQRIRNSWLGKMHVCFDNKILFYRESLLH